MSASYILYRLEKVSYVIIKGIVQVLIGIEQCHEGHDNYKHELQNPLCLVLKMSPIKNAFCRNDWDFRTQNCIALREIVDTNYFLVQFSKIMCHYKKIGYSINVLRAWWSSQSRLTTLLSSLIAHRLVGPHTIQRFRLKDLSIDERIVVWCRVFGQAHQGWTVGFILLRYSVCCTVHSFCFVLSPFYILIRIS